MSKILAEFLTNEILPNIESNTLPCHLQEEYLTKEGWLDKSYVCGKLGIHLSTPSFKKTVKQTLNTIKFDRQEVVSDITQKGFTDIYKFGTHSPRAWVGITWQKTNKLITVQDVMKYMLRM